MLKYILEWIAYLGGMAANLIGYVDKNNIPSRNISPRNDNGQAPDEGDQLDDEESPIKKAS